MRKDRRATVKAMAATALLPPLFAPAEATANPLLLRVIYQVLTGNAIRTVVARTLPAAVATPVRRFLLNVKDTAQQA